MNNSRFAIAGVIALSISAGMALPARAGLPSCPSGGATITFQVDNKSGAGQSVTLSGSLVTAACNDSAGTLPNDYSQTVTCNTGQTTCGSLTFTSREPGVWKHTVTMTVSGQPTQKQARKGVVIGNTNPNTVSWTVFKTVLPVDITTDPPKAEGTCPSPAGQTKCGLRRAVQYAFNLTSANKPVLIQFDPTAFPAGTVKTVTLGANPGGTVYSPPEENLTLNSDITIDGTDLNGNPTFRGDPFYRIVQLYIDAPLATKGTTLRFDGQNGAIIGLSIKRPTLSNGALPEDMLRFYNSSSKNNHVTNSQFDGGGANLTVPSAAHDCVEGTGASGGTSFYDANFVENTELFNCPDKAVKVTSLSYVCVLDSYIHNSLDAGVQATLSGNVEVFRSIVDKSGYNGSTRVNTTANGLAANGKDGATPTVPSVLNTEGNIIRDATQRAISVNGLSIADLSNDLGCGTSSGSGTGNGLAVLGAGSDTATATVRGAAFVYNAVNGATLTSPWGGNFGTTTADGRNAFMLNNKAGGTGHDFNNPSGTAASAIKNEWNGTGCGSGTSCSPDVVGSVNTSAVLAYENSLQTGPGLLTFTPNNPKQNQLVFMTGVGFNAVESYSSSGTTCTGANLNICPASASSGVCVEVEVSAGVWHTPIVRAVTPTRIAFEMPSVTCTSPLQVRVRQMRSSGSTPDEATGVVCTN